MDNQFSKQVIKILIYSKEEAIRLYNDYIGPEHLLLGIIRDGNNKAVDVIKDNLSIDIKELKSKVEDKLRNLNHPGPVSLDISLDEKSSSILKLSILESRLAKSTMPEIEHVLLAIVKQKNNLAAEILNDYNLDYDKLHRLINQTTSVPTKNNIDFEDEGEEDDDVPPSKYNERNSRISNVAEKTKTAKSDTPAIDAFGFDMTKAAAEGKLDPVVGREKEIERLVQILSRRKKNNPVLIGEPGVGKTAIVEGLALRINERKVSRVLFDKRIVSLDLTSVVAGTKYRGQFEERMKCIINELKSNPDIIVFIDEIHTIVGAGNQAGSMDAANMMKPALSRGELQCIGATTLDEYRKNIEKDGALERRFQKIVVEQTTPEETLTILNNIKERYEKHHNVIYSEDAVRACVGLSERYISDRCFPDKAIDVMDEVGARAHVNNISVPNEIEAKETELSDVSKKKIESIKQQNFELAASYRDKEKRLNEELIKLKKEWESKLDNAKIDVTSDMVAETVSLMTGIPANKMAQIEGVKIKGIRNELKSKIIAQDDAVDKLVNAIQRSRVGLKDPNRPIGSFLFLGPTGVGKTYMAKLLANYLFGSSDSLIRIDMSEYMEKFTVSRLVGAPPGYVGYDEGGLLTEKVRRKPYSIILLDEIEKAHPDVFNILLQVMDEGRLTDSYGRTVDFRNTVIIMTSNVGSRQLKDFGNDIGFTFTGNDSKSKSQEIIKKALNKQFSPEFRNRIDEIITFESLNFDSIKSIVHLELNMLKTRLNNLGIELITTDDTINFISKKGYDKQFGARPIKRSLQTHIEDVITDMIVEGEITSDMIITAKCDEVEGKIVFEINDKI